ncbi:MAG: hypothetical protein AAGA83_00320 [Cyanobacteria bacterium P01_F01_bin.116]
MTKTILRIEKIEIEAIAVNPSPIIRVKASKQLKDGENIVQSFPGLEEVFRKATDVATQIISITDPVTGQAVNISVAGVQAAITQGIYEWFPEEFDGQLIDGEFILNGD